MIWLARIIRRVCLAEGMVGSMDSQEAESTLKTWWEDLVWEVDLEVQAAQVNMEADSTNNADNKAKAKAKAKEHTVSVSAEECQAEWDFNFDWLP